MASIQDLRSKIDAAKANLDHVTQRASAANDELRTAEQEYVRLLEVYVERLQDDLEHASPHSVIDPAIGGDWQQPGEDFERVLREAIHGSRANKVIAQAELSKMGPNAIGPLMYILKEESVKRGKRIGMVGWAAIVISVFAFAEILIPAINGGHNWLLILITASLLSLTATSRRYRMAASALALIEDRRTVPALLRVLDTHEAALTRVVIPVLKTQLARIRPAHADLFETEDCQCMHRYIERGTDDQLIVAMLAAIEQIGDKTALPVVSRVAEGELSGFWSAAARGAAQDCVRSLADQHLRDRNTETLLRPADMNGIAAEALLRPISGVGSVSNEKLLRVIEDSGEVQAEATSS